MNLADDLIIRKAANKDIDGIIEVRKTVYLRDVA